MLSEFCRSELALIEDDGYGGMCKTAVQELIDKFAEQGHSGNSAAMVTEAFHKLSRFKPLTPLTGMDDEWIEVWHGTFQNKRCCSVFKDANGAHDINIPRPKGVTDWVAITFPYTPE